ncbi:hypothetical protein DBV15_00548 [Temnothorax longispinosus]|uniref:Uncharacterized protein n=1 Tax=Temnothorax longispinosus TaxID=300112 RepID=A0A4S2KXS9_9HYME|nr:hypothetical protein DBV15_00548 [Temnothorax longispinosus]
MYFFVLSGFGSDGVVPGSEGERKREIEERDRGREGGGGWKERKKEEGLDDGEGRWRSPGGVIATEIDTAEDRGPVPEGTGRRRRYHVTTAPWKDSCAFLLFDPGAKENYSLKIGYLASYNRIDNFYRDRTLHWLVVSKHVIVLINSNAPRSIDQDIVDGLIDAPAPPLVPSRRCKKGETGKAHTDLNIFAMPKTVLSTRS